MKCFVINLDRSADRLAVVQAEFARIGIPFERVAGIDAAAGAPISVPRLTEAEVCCFLSHRQCWDAIAYGPDQYGAVFEDDVVFSDDAGAALADDSWIPHDADVVKLETFFNRVRLGRPVSAVAGYSVRRLLGQHLGACGYILSKQAAARLLRETESFTVPVDVALFSPTQMTTARSTIYQMVPALCLQALFVPERKTPATLIQFALPPQREKRVIDRLRVEAIRAIWYLHNRPLFRAVEKVEAVPFPTTRAG